MTETQWAATAIFAATYFVVAVGSLPRLHLDRTGAALIGAVLMVAFGVLPLEEAYRAIDLNTLVLLIGMMIVVANLRISGFFRIVNGVAVRHAHSPVVLLGAVVMVAGVLSAFLVNDAICIAMTPLVLELSALLKRRPLPYLLGIAMASNVGSTATITGNPQNMLIGSFSGIPYATFFGALAPVAVAGLAMTFLLLAVVFRADLRPQRVEAGLRPARYSRGMVIKSLVVTAVMIVAFFSGQPVAKAAITAGALLLLTRRAKPEKVYREIDLPLLLLFAGLFVVVHGVEKALITPEVLQRVSAANLHRPGTLSVLSVVLSNVVSNVPAVLVLKPFLLQLEAAARETAWLALAMSSTLAGNLTITGSVANLIVVERARRDQVIVSFWDYCRVGVPLTILTVSFGVVWLAAR